MIYLGADHGGVELKNKVKQWLSESGREYVDLGAVEVDPEDDYTDFAQRVAARVNLESDRSQKWEEQAKGILLCRSGGGMVIAANRFPNVRAVAVNSGQSSRHARNDNDANVISMAADWMSEAEAKEAMEVFLATEFSKAQRHERRVVELGRMGECPHGKEMGAREN